MDMPKINHDPPTGLPGLRQLLEDKRVSLASFARNLGVNQNTIYRLSSGTINCSQELLLRIASALNVSTDELLGRVPPREVA